MRRLIVLAPLAALLAACETTPDVPHVVTDPCIASASAPLEPKPAGPAITPTQQGQVDSAVLNVLGEQAFIEYEGSRVAVEAWGDRQSQRVQRTIDWCASRQR